MEDLLLTGLMAAAFVFGYFLIKQIGRFVDRNQQWLAEDNSRKKDRDML